MSEVHTYKGCTITISVDVDPVDPRTDYSHLGTMVCHHSKYNLGDINVQHNVPENTTGKFGEDMVSLPLYLYDHSGLTMNTTGFSCPWDSGQVGLICVSRERLVEEFGVNYADDLTDSDIKDVLRDEVEEYDYYLRGDIYGFEIVYPDGTEDSCWGFYGDEYCLEQARAEIDRVMDDANV